ncbi:MAG: helix-turn-helix domain-containing protein, partial [Lachnospiraceae bacterium]
MGVSDKTISKWECGRSIPDIALMDSLCKALDITMNELLSGKRLTETEYLGKAEDNIMALMKDSKSIKVKAVGQCILGITLAVATFLITIGIGEKGLCGYMIIYYLDFPTLVLMLLFNVAGVLISGRTSREEILKVLEKIAIPIGALITLITFVVLMHQMDDVSTIGPNLVVCILSLAYAVVEYLAVVLVRKRIEK